MLSIATQTSHAQLRIVTYNTTGGIDSNLEIVLRAIGEEEVNGIARPIDVLLLQEQNSASSNTQSFVNYLNGVYGAGAYARGVVNGGPPTSGIRQTIVYRTQSVDLLAENAFGNTISTPENPAQERQTLRFRLRPDGYDSPAEFYAYNSHYRADTNLSDQAQRTAEATTIRTHATLGSDALGEGAHAIFAGDYNMRSSSETAFQTLISPGPGQANDPINRLGTWNNNSTFADVHTQSPCTSGCGASGGMDDRFDFQLVTGEFLDGEGLSYIPNSYHAFGNNGSTFNVNINERNASNQLINTYPFNGVTTYTNAQILDALRNATDHLPVVADYQLPAVLQAVAGAVPATLNLGQEFSLAVTVSNAANVVAAIGADELDYSLVTSGDISGSFLDQMDLALGGGNMHLVALDTSTPGMKSGTITISSTSQAVQSGLVTIPVSYQVVSLMLTGDYNLNGAVDAADYVVWRDTLGQNVTTVTGADGNGDEMINDEDYAVWRSHFGEPANASLASAAVGWDIAVPEPGTATLLFLAVCLGPLGGGTLRL
jgi:endonuclease/exonuclease/phosphatase family metal-dependent hydrolase